MTKPPNRILHGILPGALLTALCAAFFPSAGFAADPVSLVFQGKDRSYEMAGSFEVEADPAVAWCVLTGYEQLTRFVGNLKRSRVEKDLGPHHFLLEQEFEGGFLFITKRVRVLLDVHETEDRSIDFTDIDGKDFKFYQGSWNLSPGAEKGLNITYRLKAEQNFDAPFAGDYTRGGVKDLLEAVRREILRRQAEKTKGDHRPG